MACSSGKEHKWLFPQADEGEAEHVPINIYVCLCVSAVQEGGGAYARYTSRAIMVGH